MALLESMIKADKPSKKDYTGFAVTMVHYSKLIPSENNNYSVENIKELAYAILLSGGIKQNLLVRKKSPDEYELIAGHRRRLAVKYLVEELGYEEFSMMPVHVEKSDDVASEINLILTNSSARERSDWEKMMEVTRLTELMKILQTGSELDKERFRKIFGQGPEISGREMRKVVAEKLGLSETKVAQLRNIEKNLEPDLKKRFQQGDIGISVSNAAASLPPGEQKKLAEKEEIRIADVKKKAVSESDTEKRKAEREIPYYEIPGQASFTLSDSNLLEVPCDETKGVQAPDGLSAYGTPKSVYPPDSLIATPGCEGGHDCFSCAMECGIREKDRYCGEAPMGNPFPCETMFGLKNIQDDIGDRCQFVNHDLAFHRTGDGEADPCCKECKEPCEYICGRAMKAREAATVQQEPEEDSERQQDVEGCCGKAAGAETGNEKPETEEEILREPLTDLQLLRDMLDKQKDLLRKFLQTGLDENDDHIRKQKLLVGAVASMVTDMEGIQGEERPDQPKLPEMKNNDQRKEWLRKYRDWGLWYEDKNIGVKYYKYDFNNGARLIAEEYDEHSPYCGDYVSSFLHLVGGPEPPKNPTHGFGKWNWHKTYSHHPDSETELVEFLKGVQKR